MRLFIVQEDGNDSGAVFLLLRALQKMPPCRNKIRAYLVTDSQHSWELGFALKIDGFIKKDCFLDRIRDILKE